MKLVLGALSRPITVVVALIAIALCSVLNFLAADRLVFRLLPERPRCLLKADS